jgi:hypothetical protein
MAAPAWALAVAGRRALREDGGWVAGLALPILLTHQTEEWVRPGGFLPFCNEQLLGSDRPDWPLTPRDGFHVNISLGWSTAIVGALLWRQTPAPAAGVLLMEVANVGMHVGMAARRRTYNPGVGTAALLMAPHAFIGAQEVLRSKRLSKRGGLLAAGTGIAFAGLPVVMKLRMRRATA